MIEIERGTMTCKSIHLWNGVAFRIAARGRRDPVTGKAIGSGEVETSA